jgi:hypothetical protein
MKYKSLVLTVVLAAFAGSALAQNKISGTSKCGKPDTLQAIEAGDQAGHRLMIEKSSCTASVPIEMAGLKSTTSTLAVAIDLTGAKAQDRGYGVITMDNGDKAYVRFQGTSSLKEGALTAEGTWSYTGGTGKLKGLKGEGAYKGSGVPGGAAEHQSEGEYSLPEASATASASAKQ